jgi:hypothetical protein
MAPLDDVVVCLLVDAEPDLATQDDLVVSEEISGTSYPLVIHSDLDFTALRSQFQVQVTTLPDDVMAMLEVLVDDVDADLRALDLPGVNRGLPLVSRSDYRWHYRLAQAQVAMQMSAAVLATVEFDVAKGPAVTDSSTTDVSLVSEEGLTDFDPEPNTQVESVIAEAFVTDVEQWLMQESRMSLARAHLPQMATTRTLRVDGIQAWGLGADVDLEVDVLDDAAQVTVLAPVWDASLARRIAVIVRSGDGTEKSARLRPVGTTALAVLRDVSLRGSTPSLQLSFAVLRDHTAND